MSCFADVVPLSSADLIQDPAIQPGLVSVSSNICKRIRPVTDIISTGTLTIPFRHYAQSSLPAASVSWDFNICTTLLKKN